MRHPGLLTVLIILASVLVSGCWDRVELEDIAWVQALGFDKGPPGFLTTTMEIGIPRNLRGGMTLAGAAVGPRYTTITVVSRTALEALDLVSLNLGRRISLVHTQIFVFGEELAKADVRALVGAMDRFREIHGTTLMAVAHGRAEDVLRVNTSPLEVSPSRFIQTVVQQHPHTGLFEAATFVRDFLNPMESGSSSPRCPILALAADYKPPQGGAGPGGGQGGTSGADPSQQAPSSPKVGERVEPKVDLSEIPPGQNVTDLGGWQVPKAGGGPVIVMGMALFQGGKMVGTLTGDEARAVTLVRNDLERAVLAVPDPTAPDKPELSLGAEITGATSKVRVKRTGNDVSVKIDIAVKVSYISPKTQTDFSDPRMTPLAESAIADYLEVFLDRAVAKTQAVGSDPFGFGEKVKRTFLTWPEFEDFAWLTKYPQAMIETDVRVHIRRYGLNLQPPLIPPSEKIQSPK